MPAAPPNALPLLLDLTRRLAADYTAVPLEVIGSCLHGATGAVRLLAADVAETMTTVETLARAELDALGRAAPLALAG